MKSTYDKEGLRVGISELGTKIRTGEVSPVQLVKECLRRIEMLDSKLKAFITVMAEEAMAAAAIAESEIRNGKWRGPLHGIPVALKDFFDTKGIRTTAAFVHFKDRIPEKDAVVVTQLKAAGAVIIGKTNMHQLGMGTTSLDSHFGSVKNPWNSEYIAGGSSGGSAVAVATGMCYATIDTDVAGSCRIPASCCGVVGFKATYGRIDNTGILEGEYVDPVILKLSHVTITCGSVEDANIVYDVLASQSSNGELETKELRIAVVSNYKAVESIRNAFNASIDSFEKVVGSFNEGNVPFEKARFEIETIDRDRDLIAPQLFEDVDVLLLPTMTDLVPSVLKAKRIGEMAVDGYNTFFCNYFGLPAITIPFDFDKNGLPLGLQVVGAKNHERTVLAVAKAFQELIGWRTESSKFIHW